MTRFVDTKQQLPYKPLGPLFRIRSTNLEMLKRTGSTIHILLLVGLWLAACAPLVMAPTSIQPNQPDHQAGMGAAGLGDPIYPRLGNGGYDVTHYDITLTVDMAGNTITGTTTLQARAKQSLRAFNLDFLGLEIDLVQVNDRPARFQRAGSELTLTPFTQLERAALHCDSCLSRPADANRR